MSKNSNPDSNLKKEMKSIGKHSFIYMVGQSLTRAVGFFMVPVYTHFIKPANYGAMEIIGILSSILLLTITVAASDGMSRFYYNQKDVNKRKEVVSTVIIGFAIVAVPIAALFWAGATFLAKYVLEDESSRYLLQLAFISAWFGMLCDMGYSYLRMIYKAKLFVCMSMLQLVIALSLNICFVVFLRLDILGIFYSELITLSIIGCILVIGILRQNGIQISKSLLGEMIRFGVPLVPSRIGLMLGFASNRLFLRWLGSADPVAALAQIGLFSLGHKFGVVVYQFVSAPLNSFWAPRRMELLLDNAQDSRKTVARVCTYSAFCSIFAGLLLSSAIASVIEIMADPSYRGAHVVVPFVVLSYIALGLESNFIAGILVCKKTKLTTYITILSLVVVVAWNCVFIPRFGLIGAATSNLAGFAVRLVLIYIASQRYYPIPYELGRMITMIVTAIALYFASQLISFQSPYTNFIVRTAFVTTFPLILYALGFYHKSERQFIHETIRKGGRIMKVAVQAALISL